MQCTSIKKVMFLLLFPLMLFSMEYKKEPSDKSTKLLDVAFEEQILELMNYGDIPGLSIVLIKGDQYSIKSFGYANEEKQIPVTASTKFELGSCSKAFTALALTILEKQGKINLDNYVSDYLPWFTVTYKSKSIRIKLRQVLHHTSGIPWETIAKIPESNDKNALEQTIKKLIGEELDAPPGKEFQYATINYDILALVMQKVTGISFEKYMQTHVIDVLGLKETSIGEVKKNGTKAQGYKIGFLQARPYSAPKYKGNNAAGYVISDAKDVMKWLKFQMGMTPNPLYSEAKITHQRDASVALHNMSSYARGWEINLDGTGEIFHNGLNPNFSSYFTFRPEEKIAVAVMANSNSNYTTYIGNKIMKHLAEESIEKDYKPADGGDKTYSGISIAIGFYILIVMAFLAMIFIDVFNKKRSFENISVKKLYKILGTFILVVPFLYALYIFPKALVNFTWEAILVWMPESFKILITLLLIAVGVSFLAYGLSLFFPNKDSLKQKAPMILLMTVLSGLANVLVIIMVTAFVGSNINMKYMFLYFGLIVAVYLFGRRFVQISLTKITRSIVYDLRIRLVNKIFSASYEKFEGIDRGRVYTALNDDVNTIGGSINEIILLITSFITAVGAFIYLASLAFWATIVAIFIIVSIATLYYIVSKNVNPYFEEARNSRDDFMRLVNGMIDGFKELSLHRNKKIEYRGDIGESAAEFRDKMTTADIKFTNAFMVGESQLVILLGLVSISMSEVFPSVKAHTVMNFVVVFLYLIAPVNGILSSIPSLMNLRIAWDRVQKFTQEIPENIDLSVIPKKLTEKEYVLEAKNITYQYPIPEGEKEGFSVGPINLKIKSGEIFFIIGGNGSGKTTLAKMLTGLYESHSGQILLNNKIHKGHELSEYFSSVFNPAYLFEKLYNINTNEKQEAIDKYLKVLNLDHKVQIVNGKYNTIHLSSGQRKRLALLQCYLEDSPIYLFDEWAADQDPEYRNFFYRSLLPEMRALGKIVIAITHDDHYFDVADKVVKLDRGEIETLDPLYIINQSMN